MKSLIGSRFQTTLSPNSAITRQMCRPLSLPLLHYSTHEHMASSGIFLQPHSDAIASALCYSGIMLPYLSARQAAKLLGRTPRMAARRAKEAAEQGDPNVFRLGRTWLAPESWWREHLKPKPMGRPPRSADPSE